MMILTGGNYRPATNLAKIMAILKKIAIIKKQRNLSEIIFIDAQILYQMGFVHNDN